MTNRRGKLIIIVAPSGTGKSTLVRTIKEDFPNLHWSVSFTTRECREGELDGTHYFFISKDEFINKKNKGDFIEWASVHGNCYGTSKGFVASKINNGFSLLLELDVIGADTLQKEYGNDSYIIFIAPPSINELKNRLVHRGTETKEVIDIRIKNAILEMERKNDYDYLIVNSDLETAKKEIHDIVNEILKD